MKVGDLVRNLNSESKMTGVVVGWKETAWADDFGKHRHPVVLWADGRCHWIMAHRAELANESR